MTNTLPNIYELVDRFHQRNRELMEKGLIAEPFTDIAYYTEQIIDIYEVPYVIAHLGAIKLALYAIIHLPGEEN